MEPTILANDSMSPVRAWASDTSTWIRSASLALLCAVLLFGPLAFGAVQSWSLFVIQCGSALLFMLWSVEFSISRPMRIVHHPLYFPFVLIILVASIQIAFSTSVYPYLTYRKLLTYITISLVFFVSVQILDSDKSLKLLFNVLAIFGFVVALFAIAQFLTKADSIYWLVKPRFGAWIFGPYVNHNHYAGLMEMLTPIPLVLSTDRSLRPESKVIYLFLGAIMGSSIVLSQSRGGIIALFVQLAVLATALVWSRRSAATSIVFAVLLLFGVGLVYWLGADPVLKRLNTLTAESTFATEQQRISVLHDSIQMVRERPLLGFGLGTFSTAYPKYRGFVTDLFVNEAHNDYLQALIETGLIGFIAVGWVVWVLCRTIATLSRDWQVRSLMRYRFAALLATVGIAVHSFLDFNLQIPANALLFFVLAGVASTAFPGLDRSKFLPLRRVGRS